MIICVVLLIVWVDNLVIWLVSSGVEMISVVMLVSMLVGRLSVKRLSVGVEWLSMLFMSWMMSRISVIGRVMVMVVRNIVELNVVMFLIWLVLS